jgi:hypothetical protein
MLVSSFITACSSNDDGLWWVGVAPWQQLEVSHHLKQQQQQHC